MRTAMLVVGLGVLAFTAAALWIDDGEVISLETTDASGQVFETELWLVAHQGALYVRGARGARWVQRIRSHPEVTVLRGGNATLHRGHRIRDPETVAGVNAAMARKYGAADRIFVALFGEAGRVVIRLDPASEAPDRPSGGEVSPSRP